MLRKEPQMTNRVASLDVFADPVSCDLWARHVEPEEELTLGSIVGFFHRRIIAGRRVTKSRHILLSRENHQKQKQMPSGKKGKPDLHSVTHLASKMLVVRSCFINDSSNG